MSKIFSIIKYEFTETIRRPKILLVLFFLVVLYESDLSPICDICAETGLSLNIFEPFVLMCTRSVNIMLIPLIFIVLISGFPNCKNDYFRMIRVSKKSWLAGEISFIFLISFAMIAVLAGAVTNIILDPIFIFPLKMGMQGAAIATVIGQIVTAVLSVIYLFNLKSIKLTKKSFKLSFKVIKEFISLGITSFLAQISLVISMAVVQNMCTKYGAKDEIFSMSEYSQIPLAVLGIVMKFFQIAISISIGLSAGCIPIVGYNIGAKRKDRAKILFKYLLLTELLIGFIVLLIVELFPNKLILIFGSKNESKYYTDFAIKSFRIYLCLLPFSMMKSVSSCKSIFASASAESNSS